MRIVRIVRIVRMRVMLKGEEKGEGIRGGREVRDEKGRGYSRSRRISGRY